MRGFDNWKKGHERFKQHAKSVSHREAMMKISLMNSPTIDAQLSCQVKQTQDLHFKLFLIVLSSLKFLLSSLKFLLRQGLAVRGHDEKVIHLFLEVFQVASEWYYMLL